MQENITSLEELLEIFTNLRKFAQDKFPEEETLTTYTTVYVFLNGSEIIITGGTISGITVESGIYFIKERPSGLTQIGGLLELLKIIDPGNIQAVRRFMECAKETMTPR
jgi:hypothetical protein